MQQVCAVDAHSRPQKCQSWAHEPKISPLRGLHGFCASRRGRILREGGARKQRLLASEKSRPATRSSAALVRLGDAQEAPSNRRLRAAWLARVRPRWQLTSGRGSSHTLNSWPRARLSPLPYTIAAAAATAALVAAATAAAVTAGGPLLLPGRRPHFCYQTAVNESQKCIFFSITS